MKRFLLASALILAALPAYAGSITISVASASPAFSGTKTFTFADSDMVKFYAFVQAAYPAPPCVPVAPANTCTTTPYTLAQSLIAWAQGFMNGTVANVENYDKQLVAAPATASVTPIKAQ